MLGGSEAELELLRAAVDATHLVMVIVDAGGRMLGANRAFEQLTGRSPEAQHGSIWELAASPDERALLHTVFDPQKTPEIPPGFLFHVIGQDHVPRVVEWSARVIPNDGQAPTVLLTGIDLSERRRAEKQLGESETLQRLLLDRLPAVVWTTDRDLRFTFHAGSALDQLALEPGQVALLGTSLYAYFHTSDPNHQAIAAHLRALRGERSRYEFPWRDLVFQSCVDPFVDEKGNIIGCVGIALDITERDRAQRALERSEGRLQRLVESNVIGILFWTAGGQILEANQAFLDLVGFSREDLRSGALSWQSMTPPEYHPMDQRAFAEVMTTGSCTPYEKEYTTKDGKRVPVLIGGASLGAPVPAGAPGGGGDGSDAIEGLAFVLDLREQVRLRTLRDELLVREQTARREVELANTRLLLLVEASRRLARTLRTEDTLAALADLLVPALADWSYVVHTGIGGGRMVASAHRDPRQAELLRRLHGCLPDPEAPEGAPRVLRTGEIALYENITAAELSPRPPQWPIVGTRDPEHLHLLREIGMRSLLCVPIPGRGGGVDAVMMLASVSDPRRYGPDELLLARELASRAAVSIENGRLLAEALEAAHARDEFLSIAAHELRTPMTSLLLHVQTLQRSAERGSLEREPTLRALKAAETQAHRLSALVDDLLDVSRLAADRLSLSTEELDLAAVVRDVVASMAAELQRARCPVSVVAPAAVTGRWDRLRIERVATNLLSNAIKFGAGRPIEVRVEETARGVRMQVRDHGIGISAEDQARIFGRFERAVSVRHFGGLGLGLYISAQVVRAHGGMLRVESEPGLGACFIVELPLRRDQAGPPESDAETGTG